MKIYNKYSLCLKIIITLIISVTLSSCLATRDVITKRKLDVKTKMSETIFLDPVSKDKHIVYIKIRNTSGNSNLDLSTAIKNSLIQKGYNITEDPSKAFFILQANVLQSGKLEDEKDLYKDFGDAIVPGVIGGVIGSNAGGDKGAVIGAVAGATIGMVSSAFVEDVTYSIITDIQISQKSGVSPISGQVKESDVDLYVEKDGWKKYSTRVVSYANKVNLDFKEAEPLLVDELVKSISGVL